jgi:SAM-dependent methyltransferase
MRMQTICFEIRGEHIVAENLPIGDAVSAITAALEPIAGKHILDIGCGSGPMARPLTGRGASWAGVDPYARPHDAKPDNAKPDQAKPNITLGAAEKLPFPDKSFDSAIFVNSLHHVPMGMMETALAEAARIVRHGPIIVIEPRVDGALSDVLRIIDDETEVRTAAQQVIRRVIDAGRFSSVATSDYLRIERFADFDTFLGRMISNNPARRDAAQANLEAMRSAFMAFAEPGKAEVSLDQPMHLHILHPNRQKK